eukprot:403362398
MLEDMDFNFDEKCDQNLAIQVKNTVSTYHIFTKDGICIGASSNAFTWAYKESVQYWQVKTVQNAIFPSKVCFCYNVSYFNPHVEVERVPPGMYNIYLRQQGSVAYNCKSNIVVTIDGQEYDMGEVFPYSRDNQYRYCKQLLSSYICSLDLSQMNEEQIVKVSLKNFSSSSSVTDWYFEGLVLVPQLEQQEYVPCYYRFNQDNDQFYQEISKDQFQIERHNIDVGKYIQAIKDKQLEELEKLQAQKKPKQKEQQYNNDSDEESDEEDQESSQEEERQEDAKIIVKDDIRYKQIKFEAEVTAEFEDGDIHESVDNLLDDSESGGSKLCVTGTGEGTIIFKLKQEIEIDGFGIKSANDCPHRDPSEVKLSYLGEDNDDEDEGILLAHKTDLNFKERFEAQFILLDKPTTVKKLKLFVKSNSNQIQFAQFILYKKESVQNE